MSHKLRSRFIGFSRISPSTLKHSSQFLASHRYSKFCLGAPDERDSSKYNWNTVKASQKTVPNLSVTFYILNVRNYILIIFNIYDFFTYKYFTLFLFYLVQKESEQSFKLTYKISNTRAKYLTKHSK